MGGGRRAASSSGSSGSPVRDFLRSTPGLVVVAVVILGVAFLARFLATRGDDGTTTANPTGPGSANASYGNVWTAPDGHEYEISVETLADLVGVGSPDTCIAAPMPGASTNLYFRVTIANRSEEAAPVPKVLFGTNLRATGAVTPKVPAFARANKDLQITPLARARTCAEGAKLGPANRPEIPEGGSEVFTGMIGPVKMPVPDGVTVLVRYFEGDESAKSGEKPTDLLAPFGRFQIG